MAWTSKTLSAPTMTGRTHHAIADHNLAALVAARRCARQGLTDIDPEVLTERIDIWLDYRLAHGPAARVEAER